MRGNLSSTVQGEVTPLTSNHNQTVMEMKQIQWKTVSTNPEAKNERSPDSNYASFTSPTDTYEVSCRVTDHYSGGMRQQYRVTRCPGRKVKSTHTAATKTVQYFIAAEEIEWDYSPSREWELEKHHSTSEDRYANLASRTTFSVLLANDWERKKSIFFFFQSRQYICGEREEPDWLTLPQGRV